MGRYVEADPIGLAGGMNPFVYVDGEPVNWVDLEGDSKVKGQKHIGGEDEIVKGIGKQSTQKEIDAAIAKAAKAIADPKTAPARKRFLTGWMKVAKRGFTKVICPPFLEDITLKVVGEMCKKGSEAACEAYKMMGGQINVDPNSYI